MIRTTYLGMIASGATVCFAVALPNRTIAKDFKVLYTFCAQDNCGDGAFPYGGVILDSKGNMYGTTFSAGDLSCNHGYGCGTVFKLSRKGVLKTLHAFRTGEGNGPQGSLIADAGGNLYGTAPAGGDQHCNCGTVFKVAPNGAETMLYVFTGGAGGSNPTDPLVLDRKGSLYGTTSEGGSTGAGTTFRLSKDGHEKAVYAFCSEARCADGDLPEAGLAVDQSGNLFGTTVVGGQYGDGTVFKFDAISSETVLYSFVGGDNGRGPQSPLMADTRGDLFGTTSEGGTGGVGTVFKIASDGTETVLHSFMGGADGSYPFSSLVEDANGNLYGTTTEGGGSGCGGNGCGIVFRVTAKGGEEIIQSFEDGSDPSFLYGTLVSDGNGNLYGTSVLGGSTGYGTVFTLHE